MINPAKVKETVSYMQFIMSAGNSLPPREFLSNNQAEYVMRFFHRWCELAADRGNSVCNQPPEPDLQ